MRRVRVFLAMAVCAILTFSPASAAMRGWEPVKSERTDAKSIAKEAELEVKAAPSTIIVTTNHQVQIKIFTILGRLVNSETLAPGTSQLSLPAHGVYLVKVGSLTCKVAI